MGGSTSSGKNAPAVNSRNNSKRNLGPHDSAVQNPQQPVMKLKMKYSQVAPAIEARNNSHVRASFGQWMLTPKMRISPATSIIAETKLIDFSDRSLKSV